jgi:hypothetical protein
MTDPEEPMIDDELPRRPRRRLATPARAVILAVLIAAAGFAGGVQAQKSRDDGGSSGASGATPTAATAGGGGGFGRRFGGGGFGGGQAPADLTIGQVTSKRGGDLYVRTQDGTTVKVHPGSSAKITRSAAASAKGIYPGDRVIVQGSKKSSGTISATQITATASSAQGGGAAALFGAGPPGG